jgi:hypothetical protein
MVSVGVEPVDPTNSKHLRIEELPFTYDAIISPTLNDIGETNSGVIKISNIFLQSLNNKLSPGQIINPDRVLYAESPDTRHKFANLVGVTDGVCVCVGVGDGGTTFIVADLKLQGFTVGVGVGVGVDVEVTVGVGVGVGKTSQSNNAVKSFNEQFTVGLGVGVGQILPSNMSSQISGH